MLVLKFMKTRYALIFLFTLMFTAFAVFNSFYYRGTVN